MSWTGLCICLNVEIALNIIYNIFLLTACGFCIMFPVKCAATMK